MKHLNAFLLILLLMQTAAAAADSSTVFKCRASAMDTRVQFTISAVGEGTLAIERPGFKADCELNIRRFDDRHRGKVARYNLRLDLGECTPALPASLKTEMRTSMRISIHPPVKTEKTIVANALVFATEDGLPCNVEKFSEADFRLNAKRWKRGHDSDSN